VTATGLIPLEVEDYLTWLRAEKGRSTNTIAAYQRDLRRYVGYLDDHGRTIDQVTRGDLEQYVAWLRAEGLAPSTVARALVSVRSLHRFLVDEGHRDDDPGADLDVPRAAAGLPKALTEREIESLLDAVVGDDPVARRDRAILEVLYGTGLRISELTGLSLPDVDLGDGLLRAFGKGAKERVVPLGGMARAALTAWLEPGGRPAMEPERWSRRDDATAVFLNKRGGRLSRQGAWAVVRRYGDQVGLGPRLTPHVLRHSCATHLLDHGADIRAVQELLGHASVSTTQIYTLVSTERLWQAYRDAHPRAEGRRSRPAV
jgi:integrase/recombinase XerD